MNRDHGPGAGALQPTAHPASIAVDLFTLKPRRASAIQSAGPVPTISVFMRHVISILLQNESGALSRVATMFATRGFNIESLSVAPTEDESLSRLTLVTLGTEDVIRQVIKQLEKLIDVVAVADRTSTEHLERELALLKFSVSSEAMEEFNNLLQEHRGTVLDGTPAHFTLELAGAEQEVDAFLDALPTGVKVLSVVRSGPLVIAKGPHQLG